MENMLLEKLQVRVRWLGEKDDEEGLTKKGMEKSGLAERLGHRVLGEERSGSRVRK